MSKIKIYNGSSWVSTDGGDCNTVDNIHFRTVDFKTQYSSDGVNWFNVGMDTTVAMLFTAGEIILAGQTVSISGTTAMKSDTAGSIKGVAMTNTTISTQDVWVCVDGIYRTSSSAFTAGHVYYTTSTLNYGLTLNYFPSDRVGIALSDTELLLILPNRLGGVL